ncbi:MAG: immunoglobulin domain-containing protein [Pseudomonadales bacterium]|nr:immunoglobulin domain-containing protein [Pseudomonadales bacterium]
MLTNKLYAIFFLSIILSLSGCGATDSGHADGQSANSSGPGGGGNSGGGGTDQFAPQITQQPSSADVYEGEEISLVADAVGSDLSFQWQKAIDNTWVDLRGEQGASLSFGYPMQVDAGLYRVVVSNAVESVESNAAELLVKQNLSVEEQPGNVEKLQGLSAEFVVDVSGYGSYQYQWYKGNSPLNTSAKYRGVTSSELLISSLVDSDSGFYSVRVSNEDGQVVQSLSARLSVLVPITVQAQPQDITLIQGQSGSLRVSASGSGTIDYLWQKRSGSSWIDVSGVSGSSLNFNNVGSSVAGDYRVTMDNGVLGAVTSEVASVGVVQPVAITDHPVKEHGEEYRAVLGEAITFVVAATGTDVVYRWYKNNQLIANSSSLALSSLGQSDTGVYRCEAENLAGSVACDPIELVILTPPAIASQSSDQSLYEGASLTLNVTASGSPLPSYQWYKDGQPIQGASNSRLNLGTLALEEEGEYFCRVENEAAAVDSAPMQVEVKEIVRISSSPSNEVLSVGESATLTVVATGEAPLNYSWFKDGDLLEQGSNLTSITLSDVSASDAGSYYVTVSNQGSEENTSAAQITVMSPVSGSALISWSTPEERSDGKAFSESEVQSYNVYQQRQAGGYDLVASVPVADGNSVEIDGLSAGIYYFSLTTVDTAGRESEKSSPMRFEVGSN